MDDYSYIKLYRKATDCDLFDDKPFDRWHAFEFLMIRATWRPKSILIKGQQVKLDTGQLIYSERTLAEAYGWSRNKVRRFISLLEMLEMIKTERTTLGTIITITNYKKYQQNDTADDTSEIVEKYTSIDNVPTADRTTNDTTHDTSDDTSDDTTHDTKKKNIKKDKKGKNERNIYIGVPPELLSAFTEFAEMRKTIKKPITTEATVKRILNKLDKLADTDADKVKILNQSTDNCWQDVYELKTKPTRKGEGNPYLDMLKGE